METEKQSARSRAADQLAEFLAEAVAEKRAARERAAKAERAQQIASRWTRFWDWWEKYGASFSTVVTILSIALGAGWTLKLYFDQEQQRAQQKKDELELERRRTIVNFAGDLGNPDKRNGAAYALAVLAGKDAIPLLVQHLVASAASNKDESFRAALSQAFISIGEASLPEMIRLNREATVGGWSAHDPMLLVTQPVLQHLLRNQPTAFAHPGSKLSGVVLVGLDLSHRALDGMDFSQVRFDSAVFCNTSLRKANLSGALFASSVQLGSADLREAILDGVASLGGRGGAKLSGAKLSGVRAKKVKLAEADFSSAVLTGSTFAESDLRNARFPRSDLSDADLSQSDLSGATFYQASLRGATLANVDLRGADLEEADLSGADFAGAKLASAGSIPFVLTYPGNGRIRGNGPQVVGANLSGARNLDEGARRYLCEYGAMNVPGGCEGTAAKKVPRVPRSGFSSGSCW